MGPMIDDEIMPVFLINGFLEAGKTEFLSFTMEQEYFQTEGKTLLIVCEEGDTEYEQELLKDSRTSVVYVDELGQISPERLTELELLYNPERVLIEWNGMWNQDDLKLPKDWVIYQQITIVDMSTFELYVKNMKSLLAAMVRGSELVICNRCDDSPFSPSAARSSPAQKLRSPAPVMRMAPTAGSFSALLKMASSSLAVSGSMALRFSSRFRVTMSTPSFSWVRTFFFSSMAIHLI